jgi:hypothetical protein
MGSANRHERNNGTEIRNGVFYVVRAEMLWARDKVRASSVCEEDLVGVEAAP